MPSLAADDATGALSPFRGVHRHAATRLSPQCTLEVLKIRRESEQSADRRLQELQQRRRDKEDAARRDARIQREAWDSEVRHAKLALEGLAEQKRVCRVLRVRPCLTDRSRFLVIVR
jgi:hypothetical protein